MLKAIIYLIDGPDRDRWARVCVEWCDRKGYQVVSTVTDDGTGQRWPDVVSMLANGEADVCVVPRLDHLSANRLPRVEPITETVEREERDRERGDPGS